MRVMMYYWRYDEIMSGPGVIIVLYWCLHRFCFMKIFCQYFLLQTELSSHYVYRLKAIKDISDDGVA